MYFTCDFVADYAAFPPKIIDGGQRYAVQTLGGGHQCRRGEIYYLSHRLYRSPYRGQSQLVTGHLK